MLIQKTRFGHFDFTILHDSTQSGILADIYDIIQATELAEVLRLEATVLVDVTWRLVGSLWYHMRAKALLCSHDTMLGPTFRFNAIILSLILSGGK